MISSFTVRVKGLHVNTKLKEIKAFFKPCHTENVQFFKNGVCLVSFRRETDYNKALLKEGEIHGRQVRISAWNRKSKKIEDEPEKPCESKPSWPVRSQEELKSAIRESGRLYVRNLPFDCTEEDLEKLFSTHGSLSDVHISYDVKQQVSKGFGFITFLFPNDAVAAFEKLDKAKFMGRLLHILPAEDPLERDPNSGTHTYRAPVGAPYQLNRSEYQDAKHKELKASATAAHNWNALFIRPDAVATYLAAKFGLTKEQVLDPTGRGSVAVRLALAETQLVTEMRDFLQKHNVDLDAFSNSDEPSLTGRRDRSDATSSTTERQVSGTAFLIKNLPVGTTAVEVRELLQRHTKQLLRENSTDPAMQRFHPKRVIIPPLGITAIVEYALAQQARLIYRSLAYEPFHDSVLYVQWLPHGALRSGTDPSTDRDNATGAAVSAMTNSYVEKKDLEAEFELITSIPDDYSDPSESRPNPPRTKHTKRPIRAIEDKEEENSPVLLPAVEQPPRKQRKSKNKKERIKQQEKPPDDGAEESVPVCAAAAPVVADQPSPASPSKPRPTPKPVLLVRNVSFQATQKELSALFQPIGGLVRVRMPQKASGGHRGFAFLEFSTVDQAKVALENLGQDTHFLGRRLRIEFAQA